MYQDTSDLQQVLSNCVRTTLTAWFEINLHTEETRNIKYIDFPKHYCWNANKKVWTKRKNSRISIGRICFVSPKDPERYYLRILLHHVVVAKSFDDLKTVNGIVCSTY